MRLHVGLGMGAGWGNSVWTPASLAASLWVEAAYAGSPWTGITSAGTSGSHNLSEATHPATAGATLNGFVTASFDGVNKQLSDAIGASNFWAAGSVSFAALVNMTSIPVGAGPDADPKIFGDTSADFALGVHDGAAFLRMGSGTNSPDIALSTGVWTMLRGKCDGANIFLAKNAVAFGAGTADTGPILGGTLKVGCNFNASSFANGLFAGLIIMPVVASSTDFDNIRGYWNTKFGLSL